MIWEALVGGAVGGLLGGPWGLAVGATFGAGLDIFRNRDLPPLGAQLQSVPGPDGVTIIAQAREFEDGSIAIIHARTPSGDFLRARVRRYSREECFALVGTVRNNQVRLFVPHGTIDASGEVTLSLRIYSSTSVAETTEVDILGEDRLLIPWPDTPYRAAQFWRPLLLLGMAVSRADGHIEPVEIQRIRARFVAGLNIPASESDLLETILSAPAQPVEALVAELRLRAPQTLTDAVLSALKDIARADGEVHPNEVTLIGEIGVLLQA
jgi:uncharacterized tellurite resistance protein B-like protein